MTDPMELVRRLEAYRPTNEWGDPVHHDIADEAAACIREMVEWRDIETAPRDGRFIVAMMGDAQDRWKHLNGRAFVVRHEGTTDSGYNLGWSVYPGFGGVSDQWFSGWLPLPPAPGAEA